MGWDAGWSCRGLLQPKHQERLLSPLRELRTAAGVEHAFVLLTFGSVDVDHNLEYKRTVKKQTVDTAAHVEEMVGALATTVERLRLDR